MDITLNKRYSHYWSTDLAWSLQWARGTTSSPLDWATGFGSLFAPEEDTNAIPPPTQLQPEDFDRLHNINWQFALQFPDDLQERTAWGTMFRSFGAYLTYNAQSGTPFTRIDPRGAGFPWRTSTRAASPGSTRGTFGSRRGSPWAGWI